MRRGTQNAWRVSIIAVNIAVLLLPPMAAVTFAKSAFFAPQAVERVAVPAGFTYYGAIVNTAGREMAARTTVPVRLPAPYAMTWVGGKDPIQVQFTASPEVGYDITLSAGQRLLPANSSRIVDNSGSGAANSIMEVQGARRRLGLQSAVPTFVKAAARVTLARGLVAAVATDVDGSAVKWKEDGWTFVVKGPFSRNQVVDIARTLAAQARGQQYPGHNGVFVDLAGYADSPTEAVWQQGAGWYRLETNGWALDLVKRMKVIPSPVSALASQTTEQVKVLRAHGYVPLASGWHVRVYAPQGGVFSAWVAETARTDARKAHGFRTFFFIDGRLVGSDAKDARGVVKNIQVQPSTDAAVRIVYAQTGSDTGSKAVTYTWNGKSMLIRSSWLFE